MVYLSLSLLGPFQAWVANGSMQSFRTVKERALLAYLVVENQRSHRREALAELFWPGRRENIARNNLRQALYGIRQVIGEEGFDAIFTIANEYIQVNPGGEIWLDLAAYDVHIRAHEQHDHMAAGHCPYCMQHVRDAVEIYRGSFLEDLSLEENQPFQQWVQAHRMQYLERQSQCLEYLITEYERMGDDHHAALFSVHQARLGYHNDEGRFRRLITLLARAGRSSDALEWYDVFRRTRAENHEPDAVGGIDELVEQIRQGRFTSEDSVSITATNSLPEDLTPFIGREMELTQVTRALENPGCHLISVVGTGGVGKTRLANQAARINTRLFPDGIVFLALDAVQTTEQLVEAIGRGFSLVPGPQQEMELVLLSYLHQKQALLVLDNFEHLMESKELLLEILRAAPNVKILLTSRERLRLQAETLVEIDGLPYPIADGAAAAEMDHHQLQDFAAVRLFLERTSRVLPANNGIYSGPAAPLEAAGDAQASASGLDLDSVARICQLVDGLPLGIELAASLARDYTFAQIAEEIQGSVDFLESSMQDIPERQRSLRVSFEHSWDLLPENEREVFCKLAVFPASFSSGAAQGVAGAAMPWLMRLEDRSMVRRIGFGRYELHPLIRAFAGQKLRQFSRRIESQALQEHAMYYCSFLRNREADLKGRRQENALAEIEVEWKNIQDAWDWAAAHQAVELIQDAGFSLMYFLESRGRWREGKARFQSVIESIQSIHANGSASRTLGYLMAFEGWFCCRLTEYAEAETLLTRSLELLAQDGYQRERAFAHFAIGFLYTWMNRFRDAWAHLSTSLELSEQVGDSWGLTWAREVQTEIAFESGQAGFAEKQFLQSLEMFEHIGERRGSGRALNYLGNIALAQENYEQAREYFERLLVLAEKMVDAWGAAGGYSKLGKLAAVRGDFSHAQRLYLRSLGLLQKMGDQRRTAYTLCELAETAAALNQLPEANEQFHQALEIASRLQSASISQDLLTGLAAVLLQNGQKVRALGLLLLVLQSDAVDQMTTNRATHLADEILENLSDEQTREARQYAENHTLLATIDDYYREGLKII